MIKKKRGVKNDVLNIDSKVFVNDKTENNDEDEKKAEIDDLNQLGPVGQSILFAVVCLLLLGLGFPTILIYYLKSPLADQHFFILGISYFKLAFIFFIGAAILVYSSFFFLRTRPVIIIPVFLLSLFCCFPFIIGLKNELTLMGIILNQQFFSSWPFYLKPTYLFFELLVPAGILIYLFLQLKNIFGNAKNSYAFLCIALYLGITLFIGVPTLRQTGYPGLASSMVPRFKTILLTSGAYIKDQIAAPNLPIAVDDPPLGAKYETPQEIETPLLRDGAMGVSDHVFVYPIPPAPEKETEPDKKLVENPTLNESPKISSDLKQDFKRIRTRTEHILDLLSKMETSLMKTNDTTENDTEEKSVPAANDDKKKSSTRVDEQPLDELKVLLKKNSPLIAREVTLAEVEAELKELSRKLDLILGSISGISGDAAAPIKEEIR